MAIGLPDGAAEAAAFMFIRRLCDSMLEAETVGDVFDIIEAIEDQCEQVRAMYRALDMEPPR